MSVLAEKKIQNIRKIKRVRKKIFGTKDVPRLTITQTNKNLYSQAIDDIKGVTLASIASNGKDLNLKSASKKSNKVAEQMAVILADKLKKAKIGSIVFDRRTKKYHGVIKIFAEKLRENGIKF